MARRRGMTGTVVALAAEPASEVMANMTWIMRQILMMPPVGLVGKTALGMALRRCRVGAV
jgi:hypothetical protein